MSHPGAPKQQQKKIFRVRKKIFRDEAGDKFRQNIP